MMTRKSKKMQNFFLCSGKIFHKSYEEFDFFKYFRKKNLKFKKKFLKKIFFFLNKNDCFFEGKYRNIVSQLFFSNIFT